MILLNIFIFLFISNDALCYQGLKRIINNKFDSEKQLGYFLKTVDTDVDRDRSKQDSTVRDRVKTEYNRGGFAKDDTTERTVPIIAEPANTVKDGFLKYVPDGRSKNDSEVPLPLHVTNTARQQCVDGYQADENGICQKTLQPKNDKSFKLRRRKRAEQTAPKLSYADVVKYGRNPPKELLTTMKAELLTKKPEISKLPATTFPTPVTNRLKSSEISKTIVNDPVTTIRAAPATLKPATPNTVAAKTAKPSMVVTMPPATLKPATPNTVAAKTAKPSVVVTMPPATLKPAAPNTVAAKTAKPSVVVTMPPTKFTNRPSIVGDINQAFLSGEKSSVVSQSMDGKVKSGVVPVAAKKTIDATRLRRWIGFF